MKTKFISFLLVCSLATSVCANSTLGKTNVDVVPDTAKQILITNKANDGTAGAINSSYQSGIQTINDFLQKGQPVIVGVDYRPGSSNADGMTDHFIVIAGVRQTIDANGKVVTTYNFFDPATSDVDKGTSPNNILTVTDDGIIGSFSYIVNGKKITRNYIVTIVQPNK